MTSKVTTLTNDPSVTKEDVVYEYNLQNRLERVTTTPYISNVEQTPIVVEYAYNTQGIRTSKDVDGTVTDYLIDPSNHTGYAQVLEETTSGVRTTYTIGDDVIAQSTSGVTDYLLYDGHGSTRQLADSTGAIVSGQEYSYDGFGVMLSDSTTSGAEAAAAAGTKMLYAGEQYDASAEMYYNRARYYNPANGTFNRVDPYSGNRQDPQSLHKYAYVHANPINAIDPSGMMEFSISGLTFSMSIGQIMTAALVLGYAALPGVRDAMEDILEQELKLLIALAVAAGMTLKQLLDAIKDLIRDIPLTRTRTRKKKVYLHYGFAEKAHLFISGMLVGSYVTTDDYSTGWHAKWSLALFRKGPRDAVYFVLTDAEAIGPNPVTARVDTYIPGLILPGGGTQYTLPLGTGPGTVVGSYPIPTGSLSDVQ